MPNSNNSDHSERISESRKLGSARKKEGLTLAALAIVPLIAGALGVWLSPGNVRHIFFSSVVAWSGSLLIFFAGVRRGLTFSEAKGAKPHEIASMLWIFALGVLSIILNPQLIAAAFGVIGFASVAILDAKAANQEEAPTYFAFLRPIQMLAAILSIVSVAVRASIS